MQKMLSWKNAINIKYQKIPSGMNKQISLRLPPKLLKDATAHARQSGYGSVQEFIEECVREILYEYNEPLQAKELGLIRKILSDSHERKSWATQQNLEKALGKSKQIRRKSKKVQVSLRST
jgi:hypothetical protein